jgi:hypothetical protein
MHCVSRYPPHPALYVSKSHTGTEQTAHVLGTRSTPEQLLARYWVPVWHDSGPMQLRHAASTVSDVACPLHTAPDRYLPPGQRVVHWAHWIGAVVLH